VALEPQRHLDVLGGAEHRQQSEPLEHEGEIAPAQFGELGIRRVAQLPSAHHHRTAVGPVETADDVEQRRLARSGATVDGHQRARLDHEVDRSEGVHRGARAPVVLLDAVQFDHRSAHGRPSWSRASGFAHNASSWSTSRHTPT
jgi:hypothetical protein